MAWGPAGPQLGHSDSPFDHYETTPDVVAALSGFTRSATVDHVVARLGVDGATQVETRAVLTWLASTGLLQECGGEPSGPVVPLRTPGMEVARATGTYPDIRVLDPDFVDLYKKVKNTTQTSIPMSFALRTAVRYVIKAGIPGDIVECGVWRGGSAAIVAATLGRSARDIWLYDTFNWTWDQPTAADGLLLPSGEVKLADLESDASDAAKAQGTDQAAVRATVCETGYPANRVHCVEGLVQDTLPGRAPERVAILRLDTDLYDSTRHELEHLYPRLSPGGVLILDDYSKFSGATRAVDEYFERLKEPILLNRIDTQGRIGVKPS